MLVCPSCYTECPDISNFCLHCGKSLKSKSTTGFEKHADSESLLSNQAMTQALRRLMPTSYVEKLLAAKGQIEGERRVVTILFSDIKGSTSLAENLDPEEVLEIMNGAFDALIEPITRYEGTLARLMGDAILAFFGAPIAHEDDPYRACRAALDILQSINTYSKKLETEKGITGFSVRVGINTGLVVVAEVGADLRVEYTAMGDAVNVAARMESSAEPGTILITEATKKLITDNFEVIAVGPVQVKGKSKLINTYKVIGLKENKGTLSNTDYHLPLIGRKNELERIKRALERLKLGKGKIISVIGDQGTGKSKLVKESQKFKTSDIKWAEGRALSYTTKNSYWVIRDIIQDHFGFQHELSEIKIKRILRSWIEINKRETFSELYPFLLYLLNLSQEQEYLKNVNISNAESLKGGLHYAVKKFFEVASNKHPLVLVLEDLHWSDSSSLELLNELFELTENYPLLFLLLYRINESEADIWKFHYNVLQSYKDNLEVISLGALGIEESKMLIDELDIESKLPVRLIERIVARTAGNPFFLKELVKSIIENEIFEDKEGNNNFISVEQELEIPDLLHSIIMAKIDHLAQSEKLILQTASVIGRIFQKQLLFQILRDGFSDTELEKSLKELQQKEFILRHLPSNIESAGTNLYIEYIIKDNLVQDVLYRTILKTQRLKLHLMTAETMEKIYSNNINDFVEILANHYEKGKNLEKAINYYRVAAEKAKGIYSNEEAIYFYSKVLRLSEKKCDDPSNLINIYEQLGDVYAVLAQYSVSIKHYSETIKYLKDPFELGRIYYKVGQIYERWGKYSESLQFLNKGLEILKDKKVSLEISRLYMGLGMVNYRQGNYSAAIKFTTDGFEMLRKIGNETDIADIYNNLGIIYAKIGDLEKSLENNKKCLKIREKLGDKSGLAASYNNLGYLSQLQRNLSDAIEYYNRSVELCEKTGNLHGLARTYDNLSNLYNAQGNEKLTMEYNLKAITILGRISREGSEINSEVWLQSGVW